MYGLFYVGLRDEAAPYWEVVISTLRKVVFIGIGTFIGGTSNEFKVSDLRYNSLGHDWCHDHLHTGQDIG